MTNILVTILVNKYTPKYDPDTDSYYDKWPGLQGNSGNILSCGCKFNTLFHSRSKFEQHIKTSCHKQYISKYKLVQREEEEQKKIVKNLKIENNRLKIANKKLREDIEKTIIQANERIQKGKLLIHKKNKKKEVITTENKKLKKEIGLLKKEMERLKNLISIDEILEEEKENDLQLDNLDVENENDLQLDNLGEEKENDLQLDNFDENWYDTEN